MRRGTVKWFNEKKGFGFISEEKNGNGKKIPDIFVHFSDIQASGYRKLEENDAVEFEVSETPKGLRAVNVKVI